MGGVPYIGVFMRKDEERNSTSGNSDEMEFQLSDLHPVGTLCQVSAIRELPVFDNGEDSPDETPTRNWHVLIVGHRRISLDPSSSPLAQEPPSYCTAKVDYIDTPKFDKEDAMLQATTSDVMSTIR